MSDAGEAESLNEQGKVAFKEKRYAEACSWFTKSIQAGAAPKLKAQVLGNRSAALSYLDKNDEAFLDAKAAQDADPSYIKAYYRQAKLLLDELDRPAEALAAARAGLKLQEKNSQLRELMLRAEVALERLAGMGTGDDDEDEEDAIDAGGGIGAPRGSGSGSGGGSGTSPAARRAPTKAMEVEPADDISPEVAAEAAKESGNKCFKAAQYQSAANHYGQAMRLVPTNATYPSNKAAALLNMGKAREALQAAQQAVNLDPNMLKAHVRCAKALVQLGKFSDARRQLEGASHLDNSAPTLRPEQERLEKLENLMRNGKRALEQGESGSREALLLLGQLSQECPQSLSVACLHMEAVLTGRPAQGPSQVLAESARWLRANTDDPELLCVRGKALWRTGQLEQALKHFGEALRLDPDHTSSRRMRVRLKEVEGLKTRGNEAFSSGRYAEAVALYTECIKLDETNLDFNLTLFTNRATAHFKARDYGACVSDCDEALNINPRHVKALLRRGAARLELEQYSEAIADYETCTELEPGDRAIAQQLRQAKLEQKKSLRKDLYKVLGVTKHATEAEIKKAYRKQALQWHPDRHTASGEEEKAEAEKKFKELGEAFEILSNPEKKERYDQGADIEDLNGKGGGGGGMPGGVDPMDIFRMYTAGGMGGGMGGMPGGRRGHHPFGGGGFPGGF